MRHQREESTGIFNLLKKIWIFYSQLTKKVEARRLSMKSFNSKKVPMVGFFGNTESLSLHKSNICLSKLYHHKSQKTISICLRREFGRGLPQSTSTCRMNILQLWRLLPPQNFNQLITLSAKFASLGIWITTYAPPWRAREAIVECFITELENLTLILVISCVRLGKFLAVSHINPN